jgi:hypothetical protein
MASTSMALRGLPVSRSHRAIEQLRVMGYTVTLELTG